jgi:large subunit ribosomal protein L9
MEVILLQKVENLGGLGDRVRVKPGYGRNYLVPRGKAVPANEKNIKYFESRRAELEKLAAETLTGAEKRKAALDGLEIKIAAKASDEGKLYGSVTNSDIADAVVKAGVDVAKREIRMSQGPIRSIGEFDISIHLHTDVDATIKLVVAPE